MVIFEILIYVHFLFPQSYFFPICFGVRILYVF